MNKLIVGAATIGIGALIAVPFVVTQPTKQTSEIVPIESTQPVAEAAPVSTPVPTPEPSSTPVSTPVTRSTPLATPAPVAPEPTPLATPNPNTFTGVTVIHTGGGGKGCTTPVNGTCPEE